MTIEEAWKERESEIINSMDDSIKESLIGTNKMEEVMVLIKFGFKLGYYEGVKYGDKINPKIH